MKNSSASFFLFEKWVNGGTNKGVPNGEMEIK